MGVFKTSILEVMKVPKSVIAGIDEAGRGALAGPVVAGACLLPCEVFRRRSSRPHWSPFQKKPAQDCIIADSKMMSPEERERSFAWITAHCAFGVGIVGHDVIDRFGILHATEKAMQMALDELRSKADVTQLLIDGRDKFRFPLPHKSIIRGDSLEPCIAAGSILAKVTRDRLMIEHANIFPAYGFDGHKGYGAERHIAAIKAHGPCVIHRTTFLTRILAPGQLSIV